MEVSEDQVNTLPCSICQANLEDVGGGSTSNCNHLFCSKCIENKVKTRTSDEIGCSLVYPDGAICRGYFTLKEIESLVGEDVFQEYCFLREQADSTFEGNHGQEGEVTGSESSSDDDAIYDNDELSEEVSNTLAAASSRPLTEEEKQTSWGQVAETIKQQMERGYSYTQAMENVDRMPVWETNREIVCILCREDNVPSGQGIILKDCLHSFCRECLGQHIRFAEGQAEVSCPFVEDEYRCDSFLKPKELRALSSNEEYLKHYEEFSIRDLEKIPNAYNCRTPNCGYICIVDEDANGASAIQFQCPKCRRRNCTKCKVIHEGGCQEYWQRLEDEELERQRIARELREREDQEKRDRLNRLEQQRLERLNEAEIQAGLNSGIYERCPNCSYLCHKYTGCNHVVCGKCKHRFNWGGGA